MKKAKNLRLFFLLDFLLAFLLIPSLPGFSSSGISVPAKTITILTYSSFLGPGSLGEWTQKHEDSPCLRSHCVFIKPHPNRSLFEELRFLKRSQGKNIDIVIGIDSIQKAWATSAGVLGTTQLLMGESPLIFLVHQNFPKSAPTTLSDQLSRLKGQLIIQDPRFSALSQTFLAWGLQEKIFNLDAFKVATARVFPKWSASYEYFLKNQNLALLTFATSQSYQDCHPDSSPTRILENLGPIPKYQEWISLTKTGEKNSAAQSLLSFFNRDDFAAAVTDLNWLISSRGQDKGPDCFKKSLPPTSQSVPPPTFAAFQKWMDMWAL
jgi:ABC-type thiamine transport system substrate-binding protein